jgi:hypothetical protein
MSRNPRLILADLVTFARQFRWHEQRLVDRADIEDPSSIDVTVFEIEQGFAGSAFRIVRHFEEYNALAAELSCNPFSLPLRRAIETIPALIESRFRRWGWDLTILTHDGFYRHAARWKADQQAREEAVEQAAVSWRTRGKKLAPHHGADRVAFRAEQRGIKPTMKPEDGERAYHQGVNELCMKPMIGQTIPEVTLDEHDQLCSAVDELDRLARREHLFGTVIVGNRYSEDAEAITLADLEHAENHQPVPDELKGVASVDPPGRPTTACQESAGTSSEAMGPPEEGRQAPPPEGAPAAAGSVGSPGADSQPAGAEASGIEGRIDGLVTLDQCAALVNRNKRSLERYKKQMPRPKVLGGGGKPHEYAWSEMRPWLEKTFGRPLPERHPDRPKAG